MKTIKAIESKKAPLPIGPYSQGIQLNEFLFLSGQIPMNPQTGKVLTGDIEKATHLVLKNIGALLEVSNLNYTNVVKTLIFLKNLKDFDRFNKVYASYFTKPFPARSCIEVSSLPKDVDIEIEIIAVKNPKQRP